MAHITQTIVECDRCEEQFSNERKVRRIRLSDGAVPTTTGIAMNYSDSWVEGVGGVDLCESCTTDFINSIRMFFGNEDNK